jgi:hypothetical protein
MAEWHTHYPVQAGQARGQAVTTRATADGGDATRCDVAVRCEACGAIMETQGLAGESAARAAAQQLLAAHAPLCSGPGEES